MSSQEDVFLAGEADAWFERNKSALSNKTAGQDPVFKYLSANSELIRGKTVLEVGCSNGYRLSWLKSQFACSVLGFDPSAKAIESGAEQFELEIPKELFLMENGMNFWRDTLQKKFPRESIDCIVFGHSLYLVSPEMLPQIVATTDYLLKTGGLIAIFDFDSPCQRRKYHHAPDSEVFSYKMNFNRLFDWIPYYRLIHKDVAEHDLSVSVGNIHEDCALSILRKISIANAYPQIGT